jgi:hypothetical protein
VVNDIAATANIVLYSPEADSSGLLVSIEAMFAQAKVSSGNFTLEDWLQRVGDGINNHGFVIESNSMSISDLRIITTTLKINPLAWCLMITGDRGIAGYEELLECENIAILPSPYTTQGLKSSLSSFFKASAVATSNDNFLSGLVEGLRDPMTCISGGLQMASMTSEDIIQFVEPAMKAVLQVSEQLEYIELIATEITPHFDSFNMHDCASGLKKDLQKLGFKPQIDVEDDVIVYAEPRYTRAALKACFLLLQRFGLSSEIMLVGRKINGSGSLIWQQAASAELAADTLAPPPYLEELIRRLADKAQAKPHFEKLKDVVPNRIGLVFNG